MKADFKELASHLFMSVCILVKIVSFPFVWLAGYVDKKKSLPPVQSEVK